MKNIILNYIGRRIKEQQTKIEAVLPKTAALIKDSGQVAGPSVVVDCCPPRNGAEKIAKVDCLLSRGSKIRSAKRKIATWRFVGRIAARLILGKKNVRLLNQFQCVVGDKVLRSDSVDGNSGVFGCARPGRRFWLKRL